jgi:hypothetical protein
MTVVRRRCPWFNLAASAANTSREVGAGILTAFTLGPLCRRQENETMGRQIAAVLYVLAMVAVVVGMLI